MITKPTKGRMNRKVLQFVLGGFLLVLTVVIVGFLVWTSDPREAMHFIQLMITLASP
jgi:hypothetical protein